MISRLDGLQPAVSQVRRYDTTTTDGKPLTVYRCRVCFAGVKVKVYEDGPEQHELVQAFKRAHDRCDRPR